VAAGHPKQELEYLRKEQLYHSVVREVNTLEDYINYSLTLTFLTM